MYPGQLEYSALSEVKNQLPLDVQDTSIFDCRAGVRLMVFNVSFRNISAISWCSVLFVEETGETTDLPQVTSTPRLSGIRNHNVSGDRY